VVGLLLEVLGVLVGGHPRRHSVLVVVVTMRRVSMRPVQVVDMVAVLHRLVTTALAVPVIVVLVVVGSCGDVHIHLVHLVVAVVLVVGFAVMEVVDMTVVLERDVATVGCMVVRVVGEDVVAGGHDARPSFVGSSAR
jgi:hypothetical protein